ncbi:MAG: hypothetical protein DI539_23195 [Flavobacterium psychrophilum]|nr:MAG: hypothetical protein DI539_23195 [Flavobacterium psychrophilum]
MPIRCCFSNGQDALDFINGSHQFSFLILFDINMPKLNGFQLREKLKLDMRLNVKCIPYLVFTCVKIVERPEKQDD